MELCEGRYVVDDLVDLDCDLACQFEWIEVSSNFFTVAVYTPALIVGLLSYVIYKIIKKSKNKVH